MNAELRPFSEDRSPQALSVSQTAGEAGADVARADDALMEQGQEGAQAGDAGMVRAAENAQKPEKRARRSRFGRRRKETESETTGLAVWRAVARRNLFTVGIFSLFVNLLMLTIPIYLFQLSDRVLTSRSLDTLVMLSLLAMGFMIVMSLLDILRKQVLGRVATQFETILGGIVLAGMVGGPRREEGGNANAMRQLHQVRGFISGPVMLNLFDAPMAPFYFGAVFLVHPHLGMIAVASGLSLLLAAILNQKATSGSLREAGTYSARADAQAEALSRNSQVINAMGMLNEAIQQWGRSQSRALVLQTAALDRNYWISGLSKFVRLLTQIAMLGWGAYLALNGEITGGTMIAASIIAARALQPIEGMIEGWRGLVQARAAYASICNIVASVENEKPRMKLPKPKGHVIVDKVLYIPPGSKEPVLNGLGFELLAGESLAIVGPSGAGKSTLARILVGFITPTAGRVRLDGTELRNWDRRQFGEFTGYLPQEVELFPGEIKLNISRMRSDSPDQAVYEAAVLTSVHEMVTRLNNGYETVIDGHGAPLSGGQKQRIALARAFFGNPSLVVLDEPNSNLDAVGEQALAETLQRAKEKGITVVTVTQRPALLNCVDKVLILRGGRIEAFGPPQEVLHRAVRPPEPVRPPQSSQIAPPPLPQLRGA